MRTLITFLLLIGPLYAQTPNFKIQVVDNQIAIGYGLAVGDVDGDRKPDILMADQKEFVWYRNPGKAGDAWKRHVMAANLTPQDNVCIAARDIDGDGRVEVAVGAGWNPSETNDTTKSGAVFYLIRPKDPTQTWEPVRLHHEITTHRMRWARVGNNQYQLIVVPLHGLGNKNGEGRGVRVLAYEPPKDVRKPWKRMMVDSALHMTHNFEIWEDAGETRMLIGSKEGGKQVAYRNGRWMPVDRWIGAGNGMGEVRRGFQGDRKVPFVASVEPMHGNKLVVYKNGPIADAPNQLMYGVQQTLTEQLSQGHALVCADFLKLGSDQVAVGWRNPNADKKVGVRLFVPDNTLQTWKEYPLDDSVMMACEDLQAADLDNDGDLDLIASGRATLNVLIYWNQR
ncbi:FG-GAP repeat domain-containing protein [Larkinella soli]|uniref:FG-GAP repeat domain-containing protein n=1 Tax=Larkinella soli TaxID=1770527 RepID=UPI000FFB9643|nr:VCBS repeat-containing protein [Larkinella soli]